MTAFMQGPPRFRNAFRQFLVALADARAHLKVGARSRACLVPRFRKDDGVYARAASLPQRLSSIPRRPCGREGPSESQRTESCVLGSSRSEEHTSELQSRENLVCRLLLEKKNETIRCSRR